MIRITGGVHRGRVLPARIPAGVRPTSGRVREAVFSMVGQDLGGWSMLDAFSGSGLMAIEAASRGAQVEAAERNAAALACIRENVRALGVQVRVHPGDVEALTVKADFIYLDPPFSEDIAAWLHRLAPRCSRVLVAEARDPVVWPAVEGFAVARTRTYGDTAVAVYRRG